MFKVVTDQLKVSQGWVRCGQCTEVFDASLHLQAAKNPPVTALNKPAAIEVEAGLESEVKTPVEPIVPKSLAVPVVPASPLVEEPFVAVRPLDDNAVGVAVVSGMEQLQAAQVKLESPDSEPSEVLPDGEVSFVRDSRRQAFWRRPAVRFALGLSGLLLVALLLVQFSVQQRDTLAAIEPQLKPWLQILCEPLQCDIAPLRHIEAVVIDSSSFNKINSDSYRLNFSLKNTGITPVAMPSLEVSLTDGQEQAVIRRVVMPAQFGVTGGRGPLGAGAEFSGVIVMQVLGADALSTSGLTPPASVPLRVAGYRVLAFYP